MARDDCGGRAGMRGQRIVHTRPVHAVMAVHTVYQSNAYRIDFNICVRKWEEGRGRREEEEENMSAPEEEGEEVMVVVVE